MPTTISKEFEVDIKVSCSLCGKQLEIGSDWADWNRNGELVLEIEVNTCECSSNESLMEKINELEDEIAKLKNKVKLLEFGS